MFTDLVQPRFPTTKDTDFRDIFDPTNSPMFKRYEGGYSIFLILSIPNMLAKLTTVEQGKVTKIRYKDKYANLIRSYVRTLEREFKKLYGLENISSDSIEFSGLNEVSVNSINKVSDANNITISLTYTEPYGAPISKVHELYLKGIDDPIIGHRKHYNGLIDDGILAPSFKNEVFSFLYIVTDNTGLNLERAYYLFNAQPISSLNGDLYNAARGEIEYKENTYDFKCNVLSNRVVSNRAKTILQAITGCRYDESDKTYKKVSKPVWKRDSTDYDNYRVLVDTDETNGFLNFPKDGKDITYIEALKRQLGVYRAKIEVEETVDSSITNTNIKEGDSNVSKPSNNNNVKIDSPKFKVGDIVKFKQSGELVYYYANGSEVSVTMKGFSSVLHKSLVGDSYSKTYKIRSVKSAAEAQTYAKNHNTTTPYADKGFAPYAIWTGPAFGEDIEKGAVVHVDQSSIYKATAKNIDTPIYNTGDTVFIHSKNVTVFWTEASITGNTVKQKSGTLEYFAKYVITSNHGEYGIPLTLGSMPLKIKYVKDKDVASNWANSNDNYKPYASDDFPAYSVSVPFINTSGKTTYITIGIAQNSLKTTPSLLPII